MKKLVYAALVTMLVACSGPTDIKLSEMNEPQNAKKLLEALSPEDRAALQGYLVKHMLRNDIDYKMTVKEAIKAYKTESEQERKGK